MALSGTLETFSLPDVLRLLSSTEKSGLLRLDGDRGVGRVWVVDGDVVSAESDGGERDVDGVVFDLLRFVEGAFEFDSGVEPPEGAGAARPVDDVLVVAEARLEEWREIEARVPSLDVRVRLVHEVDGEVTVSPPQWQVLARVGAGTTGHRIATQLELGELEVCRQLRDLIDDRLVEIDEHAPVEHAPVAAEPEPVTGPVEVVEPVDAVDAIDPIRPTPEPEAPVAVEHDGPVELDGYELDTAPEPTADAADAAGATDDDGADDDFLSQLSHLSPRAAAAVEATSSEEDHGPAEPVDHEPAEPDLLSSLAPADEPATSGPGDPDEEPGAGTDPEATDGEDDINQNVLLRFLSSAR